MAITPVSKKSSAEGAGAQHAAGSWPGRRERRAHLRVTKSNGVVELVEIESGDRFEAHLSNLGREGCHVKTDRTVLVGTMVKLSITVGKDSFRASARVVYVIFSKGMGLLFTNMEPESSQVLAKWLGALLENTWLVSSRRRKPANHHGHPRGN